MGQHSVLLKEEKQNEKVCNPRMLFKTRLRAEKNDRVLFSGVRDQCKPINNRGGNNYIPMIAHEINNPLDAVIRYVSLASHSLDDKYDAKSIEFLHEAEKGLQRIAKIIKDVAGLSQCMSHTARTIDINREIEESCDMVADYSRLRNVVIRCRLGAPLPIVPDFGLRLAFKNIIANACDAMEKGGILTITSAYEASAAIISFRDTGSGISRALCDTIFDPFVTTKKSGTGSGLGLAIAREIIQKYRGAISVASEFGKGTTFSITIPIT